MIATPPPLLALIGGRLANGSWTLADVPSDAGELIAGRGWHAIEVDLGASTTKSELLAQLAEAGQFPDYFGGNWDAAADCLTDLAWLEPDGAQRSGVVVIVRGAQTWAASNESDAGILLDIMNEAAAWWTIQRRTFLTIWEGRRPPVPALDLL